MKSLAGSLVVTLASLLVGGCSSGGDVYIETSSALTGPACEVPRAEQVPGCGRWADLPGVEPELLTFLNTAIALEDTGNWALKDVDYSCAEILYRLGVAPEPLTPADPRRRIPTEGEVTATCRRARHQIDIRRSSSFLLQFGGLQCQQAPMGGCVSANPDLLVDRDALIGFECHRSWVRLYPGAFETEADYRLAETIEWELTRLGILTVTLGHWQGWFTQAIAAIESEKTNVSEGHECMVSEAVDGARAGASRHDLAVRLATEVIAGITEISPEPAP